MQPLDNPVWHALNSADSHLNQGDEIVAYFAENVAPFVGMENWEAQHQLNLAQQLPSERSWSVMIANPVIFEPLWTVRFTTQLFQMICQSPLRSAAKSKNYRLLTKKDLSEMLSLTALTKPGPFYADTICMGNYYGIFEGDQLVAMAGERLHLSGFTEISAVCVHPNFTGKGYGTLLVSILLEEIIQRGKTPFLHVRADNKTAIHLYEKLGFEIRSEMYFGIISKS